MGIAITPPGPGVAQGGANLAPLQAYLQGTTPQSATAAVNTAVTITITGVAGQQIRITSLSASYNAAPTGGTLTVVVNAVTILQLDLTAAGPALIPLPDGGLLCQAGQNAVITLTAAGAAVTGRLNVSFMQK